VFGNTVVKTETGSLQSTSISGDSIQFDNDGNLIESSLLELIMQDTK